jgi:glutamyl-tRNA synthetase
MTTQKVRVRFAPSPTGPLHIGGVRTALYNYLFARKHGGTFILRIEDTDQTRFVPGAEQYIMNSLKWCGITVDEGIEEGGEYGPYRQSDRKPLYRKYADELINKGCAYYAFDTPEELETMRKQLEEEKASNTSYSASTRGRMKNSITLSQKETQDILASGASYVIRFKMPDNEEIVASDLIRGEVRVNTSTLDDKVLFKSDGMPTYHLANVVDDYLMKITHVIRGEEWLPSMPLHVMLYRSFGWDNVMPKFSHLPLLLKPDGKGKLSKRDGDKLGFPVFPLQWTDPNSGEISSGYRESGYFPQAFINILVFLGWNPGTEQEIFTMQELADAFSIDHIHKAGARFDFEKAKWFNHQYLVAQKDSDLAEMFIPFLKEKGIEAEKAKVERVCSLVKERVNFVKEMWDQASFFFVAPQSYDTEVIKKRWKPEIPSILGEIIQNFNQLNDFTSTSIHDSLHHFIESKQYNFGQVMNCLRLAMVGTSKGPDLPVIMEFLGKNDVIFRIEKAVKSIS